MSFPLWRAQMSSIIVPKVPAPTSPARDAELEAALEAIAQVTGPLDASARALFERLIREVDAEDEWLEDEIAVLEDLLDTAER